MTIGQKLERVRRSKGIGQQELAQSIFMTQQAYSRIENDQTKVTHDQLKKITEALGISIEELEKWDGTFVFNNFGNPASQIQFSQSNDKLEQLYEKVISQKDAEITYLKSVIDRMLQTQ